MAELLYGNLPGWALFRPGGTIDLHRTPGRPDNYAFLRQELRRLPDESHHILALRDVPELKRSVAAHFTFLQHFVSRGIAEHRSYAQTKGLEIAHHSLHRRHYIVVPPEA